MHPLVNCTSVCKELSKEESDAIENLSGGFEKGNVSVKWMYQLAYPFGRGRGGS